MKIFVLCLFFAFTLANPLLGNEDKRIDPTNTLEISSSNARPIRVATEFTAKGVTSKEAAMKDAEAQISGFWRNFGKPLSSTTNEKEEQEAEAVETEVESDDAELPQIKPQKLEPVNKNAASLDTLLTAEQENRVEDNVSSQNAENDKVENDSEVGFRAALEHDETDPYLATGVPLRPSSGTMNNMPVPVSGGPTFPQPYPPRERNPYVYNPPIAMNPAMYNQPFMRPQPGMVYYGPPYPPMEKAYNVPFYQPPTEISPYPTYQSFPTEIGPGMQPGQRPPQPSMHPNIYRQQTNAGSQMTPIATNPQQRVMMSQPPSQQPIQYKRGSNLM